MRLLCVQPGASYSRLDVFNGMVKSLRNQGHDIVQFALDSRIGFGSAYLHQVWKHARRTMPDLEQPSAADSLYFAGQGVIERALRFQPDWVLIWSAMFLHPDILVLLKRAGQKVGIILTESPYDDMMQVRVLPYTDIAWTNERSSVDFLRQTNPNVHYLPPAHDPSVHYPASPPDGTPAHDVVFVGSGFEERVELLRVVNWDGIDFGLYGSWGHLGSRHRLRRYLRDGVVPNDQTVNLYRAAKIGLNLYRQSIGFGRNTARIEHAESLNPRAVELAACGAFTISDARQEVDELFGANVPTFQDAAHLESLIRHYLTRPALREQAANAARDAIADWTFDARATQLMGDLVRLNAAVAA